MPIFHSSKCWSIQKEFNIQLVILMEYLKSFQNTQYNRLWAIAYIRNWRMNSSHLKGAIYFCSPCNIAIKLPNKQFVKFVSSTLALNIIWKRHTYINVESAYNIALIIISLKNLVRRKKCLSWIFIIFIAKSSYFREDVVDLCRSKYNDLLKSGWV